MSSSAIGERPTSLAARLKDRFLRGDASYDLPSLLIIGGGAVAVLLAIVVDYFGSGLNREFGHSQLLALLAGTAAIAGGGILEVVRGKRTRADALRFWAVVSQIALLALAFRMYHLETRAFYDFIMSLTLSGFIINHYLPPSLRLPFFLLLSMAGFWGIYGAANAMEGFLLIGLGIALFSICHLPISLWARVVILTAFAVVLAAVNMGWIKAGDFSAVLPILASIFMLRLAIYIYDLESGKLPASIWHRLSYFFMLPNAVFPFFPVIDSATFGRTYYNDDATSIYQRGAIWMFRGFIHLLLYRAINSYFLIAPEDVHGVLDFLQYVVANFALYFKISGLFHLIIGMLLLFGFNLPETHAKYLLSSSFIDFWRRINIYWKDFMQKMFFTPIYLRLKNRGLSPQLCLVLSIAVVFFATWALHAYQWFWLRGTVLFTVPDIAFWSILAILLIAQTLYEAHREATPPEAGKSYLLSDRSFLVIRTVCAYATISILWSLWTSESVSAWIALWKASGLVPAVFGPTTLSGWIQTLAVGALLVGMVPVTAGVSFGLAPYRNAMQDQRRRIRNAVQEKPDWRTAFGLAALAVLVLVQLPTIAAMLGSRVQAVAHELNETRLSEKDHALLERGYYENLTNVNRMNSQLWHALLGNPNGRIDARDIPVMRPRSDFLDYEYIPNTSANWMGKTYVINRWGMNDKDYDLAKPAGTFRIAMLGASREAGWGVDYEERFETIIENRLNSDPSLGANGKFEILNFGVDGYVAYQRLMVLNEKVWPFNVDAVFYMAGEHDPILEELTGAYKRAEGDPPSFLADIIRTAGIKRSMDSKEIIGRLSDHRLAIAEAAYKGIVEACRQKSIRPVWIYIPRLDGKDPYESAMTELAKKAGFIVINIDDTFRGKDPSHLQAKAWDFQHPNADGHRLLADSIYAQLLGMKDQGQISLGSAVPVH